MLPLSFRFSGLVLLLGAGMLFPYHADAQLACPENLDFELGNLSGWQLYTGSCCPISTPTLSGPVLNRHTLTSGTMLDPYGNFPTVAPGGGAYSLMLGNNQTGAQAERARYYVRVPAGVNNYSLIYRYAVVFEDPGHIPAEQPRFEVKAYDSATGAVIPCAQYTYIASSSLPGFTQASHWSQVWYKTWTTASLDLSGFAGQTVAIDFASGDCAQSGHFGYGYVDMSCGLFAIMNVNCDGSDTTVLSAPHGFQSYQWTTATYTPIDTGQLLTIPTPATNAEYHVILTPYTGYGCPDTLTTRVSRASLVLNPTKDTVICSSPTLQMTAGAQGTAPYSYHWTPATGLSCVSCPDPVATLNAGTTYYLTVTDANGCVKIDSVFLANAIHASVRQILCADDTLYGYGASGIFTDTLTSAAGCDSIRTLHLTVLPNAAASLARTICEGESYLGYTAPGTYTDTLVNSHGCDSIRTLQLTVLPRSASFLSGVICEGESYLGYTKPGIYRDTLANIHGCDSIRTLQLTVHPVYFRDSLIKRCAGDSVYLHGRYHTHPRIFLDSLHTAEGCDSVIRITLAFHEPADPDLGPDDVWICREDSIRLWPGSYQHYQWSTGATTPDIHAHEPGYYTVRVWDIENCEKSDTIQVHHREAPYIRIRVQEGDICRADTVHLWAEEHLTYRWYEESRLAGTGPDFHTWIFRQKQVMLAGTDIYGCTATESITLQDVICCGRMYVPTAFSPNGDGMNDHFRVITTAVFERFEMMVMDRWGAVIFQTFNTRRGWDGTRQGYPAEMGTYFYRIRAKCFEQDEPFLLKGDITLLR